MKFTLFTIFLFWSTGAFSSSAEIGKVPVRRILEDLVEVEMVVRGEDDLTQKLTKGPCATGANKSEAEDDTQWASFLKLSLIESGTKPFTDVLSEMGVEDLNCGEGLDLDPTVKMWGDRTEVYSMSYSCPDETMAKGAGVVPSVILEARIDNKQCFISFKPEILDEILRTSKQATYSESALSKFANNVSCLKDDKEVELVAFSSDENNNFKIIKDGSFNIEDIEVLSGNFGTSFVGASASAGLNLNGPKLGATYTVSVIGNVMSLYAEAPVTANGLMSSMLMSDETKKNFKSYLKDNNIDGSTSLYAVGAEVGGKNYLEESTGYKLDDFAQQMTRVGLHSIVSKGIDDNKDVTLKLNNSFSTGNGYDLRATGHMRVNDDIDVYGSYGLNSTVTATYDIGDSKGLTVGAQASTLGGAGLCTGYFSQEKNGVKKKNGVCISQGGGEFYSQPGCPELYGTSCTMSVTSIFPADGLIDIKTINMMRPGEFYRLDNGNLVGLRKVASSEDPDQYHFQLYQYPEDINKIRKDIFKKEKYINSVAPIVIESLPLDSKRAAQEYNFFLSRRLQPYLFAKGKGVKGVRVDLSGGGTKKNELTSDGVLIVRNFNDRLFDVEKSKVDYSLKRKSVSGDNVDKDLANIVSELQDAGVILDFDLNALSSKEQEGLKMYLKFLTANYGLKTLKGRRVILNEDPTTFLGFGEKAFNFSGTDLKVSLGVLEKMTDFDFGHKVPSDFTPTRPEECDEVADKDKCMQDALLSVIYSNNFQLGGNKVVFADRATIADVIPENIYVNRVTKFKRVPTIYEKDGVVYVLNEADKIEDFLEPGIFHSPVNSLKEALIPDDLEDSFELMSKMTSSAAMVEQVAKNHKATLGNSDAELYNFKNRGNNQYHFSDVYENEVKMEFNGKEVSNCFMVKDGVATAFYKSKGESCGDLKTDPKNIVGAIDLKDPDKSSPIYQEVFSSHLSALMDVKELKN
tara:strand:- start:265038 stop:267950 length:2913 start_codon:yes stop_codon:yes gene_type:complete